MDTLIDHVAGSNISNGAVVRIGQILGVALTAIASGATGSVAISGVFRLPKVSAAVIAAGLHGVEKGLKLTAPPITGTNQGADHIPRAPRSLIETTRIFQRSDIARDWLGDTFVDHFAATREWEHRQWQDAVTDWELKRYFEII